MAKKDRKEQAKENQDLTKELVEIDPRIINALLGATASMHGEIKFALEDFQLCMSKWEERLQVVEDSRREQLLASQSQLEEIEKAEKRGFTIEDKTFIAHVLGTNQLIFEIMGKMQNDLEDVKSGLKVLDHRTQSFEMEQALMREQIADIKKKWMPIISKQTKVIALALITIALSLGLGSFLRAVSWW